MNEQTVAGLAAADLTVTISLETQLSICKGFARMGSP